MKHRYDHLKTETTDQYLARGGKITKVGTRRRKEPSTSNIEIDIELIPKELRELAAKKD